MNIFEIVEVIKALFNTFIRIMPLGLYFFTYFSSTLYGDKRSGILLLGLILNDLIGHIYNKYGGVIPLDTCAVFSSTDGSQLNFLTNTHTEIMAFIFSFFGSEMYKKGMKWFKFNFLLFMMIVTIWSRMNVGCETNLQVIMFNILFGVVRGALFYHFMAPTYDNLSENKSNFEKEACDSEYSDYTCETIKDGNVIIKGSAKNPELDED